MHLLEQICTVQPTERPVAESISTLIKALGGRISSLEQKKGTFQFLPQKSNGNWSCPADSCNRSYKRLDLYHEHIRKAKGHGHAILKRIIEEQTCRECDYTFESPNGLLAHDRLTHGQNYLSRIHIVIPFLRLNFTPEETSVSSQLRSDQPPNEPSEPAGRKSTRQPKSSPNIKSTRVRKQGPANHASPLPTNTSAPNFGSTKAPSLPLCAAETEENRHSPPPSSFVTGDFGFAMVPDGTLAAFEPGGNGAKGIFGFAMDSGNVPPGLGGCDGEFEFAMAPSAALHAADTGEHGAEGNFDFALDFCNEPPVNPGGHDAGDEFAMVPNAAHDALGSFGFAMAPSASAPACKYGRADADFTFMAPYGTYNSFADFEFEFEMAPKNQT